MNLMYPFFFENLDGPDMSGNGDGQIEENLDGQNESGSGGNMVDKNVVSQKVVSSKPNF